ncbi:ferritin family protein [Sporolituus thermophilus]|uniref:Rubrerythrin n=1 Tax=Sporolituus thermophilus DSM 23256 TaxID=1123285 RepID=A0A1G7JIP0_9FIRM|nr:ferritin-like domain-containing protein [Sporolituus thermophilus]SDF24790.1 Rubrerythrin [Sporolituus thermophilus DSM 23256]
MPSKKRTKPAKTKPIDYIPSFKQAQPPRHTLCPDDPDLLRLRDAAKNEREAIDLYLEAALRTPMADLFLDVAEDEMHHYVELMRLISSLDPVQAAVLKEENLGTLTLARVQPPDKWKAPPMWVSEAEDVAVTPPAEKDLPTIHYLTKSLAGELEATNKYQIYMAQAEHDEVRALFCHIMNEEKEHIAEFTAALYRLTNEPLPGEGEED